VSPQFGAGIRGPRTWDENAIRLIGPTDPPVGRLNSMPELREVPLDPSDQRPPAANANHAAAL
jgi:hypothetical protein